MPKELTPQAKIEKLESKIKELQSKLQKAQDRIHNCHNYLMSTPKKEITVEDALQTLGYNEDGY